MAQRRMFSKAVIDFQPFTECTTDAKYLYIEIAMHADDDGIFQTSKTFFRTIDIAPDKITELINAGLLIDLKDDFFAVRDWRIHNELKKDRYTPTLYLDKKDHLIINRENRYVYVENPNNAQNVSILYTDCIHSVSNMEPQDRIGKDRIGKDRIGEVIDRTEEGERQEKKDKECEEKKEKPLSSFNTLFTEYCLKLNITDNIDKQLEFDAIKEKSKGDAAKAVVLLKNAISQRMKI